MRIAYFDCFAGASGDMILGALLDAGLELEVLRRRIAALGLDHYSLDVEKVQKRGIGGSQAVVSVDQDHHAHHHRHLHDIEAIITHSGLPESVKVRSLHIFRRLAEAEARVHRSAVENVHFHEVGAMDAIIDVVGAVAGLEALGVEKVYCSPLHVGSGTVQCAHGVLPVPAPATTELIRDKPIYSTGVVGELLTPTGAAILTTLAGEFGPMPPMTPERIGYGAGTSDPAIPNLLRVTVGETRQELKHHEMERSAVIEATIDDMNPQICGHLMEKMLGQGAQDVFFTPVQMKKNRPGTMITVICPLDRVEQFADFLLRESTTIGLRWRIEQRVKMRRTIREVRTRYGTIRVKLAHAGEECVNAAPEYDDCRRLASESGVPLKEIMEEARAAGRALRLEGGESELRLNEE